jgi:3-oxoacyl-[acyl-carrier protein] reductase
MTTVREMRALVCGSTQGIGRACAMALANAGMSITLLARNRAALEATCSALPGGRDTHGWLEADFTDPDAVRATVGAWLEHGEPVHVLVNNTGGPPGGAILEAAAGEFERALRAHLVCNQFLAQLLVPGMRAAGYGRIINIISTSVKQPIPNLGVSNTIRAAVASWSKTLAGEVGPDGITVNNILPGATRTGRLESVIRNRAEATGRSAESIAADMQAEIPLRRFAEPDEIAATVAFLASPEAGYISGVNLPVDGGRTACL